MTLDLVLSADDGPTERLTVQKDPDGTAMSAAALRFATTRSRSTASGAT